MWPLTQWRGAVDFLMLAAALYVVLRWANQARALRFALSIVALHLGALLARHFDLIVTSWVLEGSAVIIAVLLVVVFQSELRRAFTRLDSALRLWPRHRNTPSQANRVLAQAAFALATIPAGALIVVLRRDSVGELVSSGVRLGAEIAPGILEAVFQKASPLHDGAILIEGDRITHANVVLPLTQRDDVPAVYGTRHRAAMGLAERCDALVVAVSEERGEVTMMEGRRIRPVKDAEELAQLLREREAPPESSLAARLRGVFLSQPGLKLSALALAILIWAISFLLAGITVRTVSVPIEFDDVPAGWGISRQSATTLEAQLRGRAWVMASVDLGNLVAHFSLKNARQGVQVLHVGGAALDLPLGITAEQVRPREVTVRLTPLSSKQP
jgi:diadenylate cyclase